MNLEEIKSELRKLSELVGDWSEQRPIPPLERDLVLEKLRAIYEALRFGLDPSVIGVPKRVLPAAAVQPEPAAQPRFRRPGRFEEEPDIEVVDLNEVLSLDEVAESAEPDSASAGHADASAASTGYTAPVAQPAASPVAEPEPEEGPEVIEFVPEPEPAPAPHVAPTPRPQAAPVPPAYEAYEEPAREPVSAPVVAETPAPKPAPAPQSVSAPAPVPPPQPEAKPRPEEKPQGSGESQSLFGPDDEMVRRRHKQRVIMSLYDGTPKPAEPVAVPKPVEPIAPKQEEPAAAAPAAPQAPAAAPRSSAAPADEPEIVLIDTGSEESAAEAAEPEDEGPEILILDDEPAEAPAPHLFASVPQPAEAPAPRQEVHAPAASRPVVPPAPAAPRAVEKPTGEPASFVLGEVINQDVRTLGDTMSAPRKNYGAPVADLRQAIGINDKFLMIRDLFGGNSVLFDATITALNAQKSLDDCMIYIAEHFAWNPDSESARLVMELLERKFA